MQALLGGLWGFPGGKRERGETFEQCVQREVREELGIEVKVGKEIAVVEHGYSHFAIRLHAFSCEHVRGRVRLLHATAFKWVRPGELKDYAGDFGNSSACRPQRLLARTLRYRSR